MSTKKSTTATKSVTKVLAFIASASVEGLHQVMVAIQDRDSSFSDDQNAKISALIADDAKTTTRNAVAANETGLEGWDEIAPVVASATYEDIKKYVHAVDLRLFALPPEQQDECMFGPRVNADSLADLLGLGGDDGFDPYADSDDEDAMDEAGL